MCLLFFDGHLSKFAASIASLHPLWQRCGINRIAASTVATLRHQSHLLWQRCGINSIAASAVATLPRKEMAQRAL
jgi:hypothetical protein